MEHNPVPELAGNHPTAYQCSRKMGCHAEQLRRLREKGLEFGLCQHACLEAEVWKERLCGINFRKVGCGE